VQDRVQDFIVLFTSILYEAMPFIVLGAILAGVLEELVPQQLIARIVPKNRFLAIVLASGLGLVFPMCECGIVPVMRRLLRKGLPLGCCVAYLLAGPIINPVVIFSTIVAFQSPDDPTWLAAFQNGRGQYVVLLRILGGFLVAVITALIVERLYRKHGNSLLTPLARPGAPLPQHNDVPPPSASESPAEAHQEEQERTHEKPTVWRRLNNISETALHDFVDITVFLILGALLAATARMFLSHGDIESLSTSYPVVVILAMMGLAILLCLCSEADAFVAASFTSLAPSAKLAFLVLGPMFDLKLYVLYSRVFKPKLKHTIFGSVVVLSFLYALGVHLLWSNLGTVASWFGATLPIKTP
jgi:uncharacterized membrane protein YraQ (UPF0718 family)